MIKRYLRNRRNKRLSARQVFSEVYAKKKWGDKGEAFFSGPGSYDEFAVPYVDLVSTYLVKNFPDGVTFVDLGCGDFRVGEKLVNKSSNIFYHGVDVVPALIEHHQSNYATEGVRFDCLDLVEDPLPQGDVAAIRQVLQHLSNTQIDRICKKFQQYKAVFITEHYPAKVKKINLDIVHGRSSRRKLNSAVFLDQAPFSLSNLQQVLSLPHRKPGETLVTYLYQPV